jgi:DNA mismatch endonuclease (patch repair protein)
VADNVSRQRRSRIMARVLGSGNRSTELLAIELFRKHRCRGWRRNVALPGKPDFVFRRVRTAVFIDGCFWHGCPKHCRVPSSNVHYWQQKIGRNRKRDALVSSKLRERNWNVVRVWEHELRAPKYLLKRLRRALEPAQALQQIASGGALHKKRASSRSAASNK